MDEAYLQDLRARAHDLADALMPPRLYGPRSREEWAAIESALEDGFAAGGFRWNAEAPGQVARAVAASARVARRLRESE